MGKERLSEEQMVGILRGLTVSRRPRSPRSTVSANRRSTRGAALQRHEHRWVKCLRQLE